MNGPLIDRPLFFIEGLILAFFIVRFPLVILLWVYLLLPSLLLNKLCTSALIRDLSRLCGIEVYKGICLN